MTTLERLQAECKQHEANNIGHTITVNYIENENGYHVTVDKNGVGSVRVFVEQVDEFGIDPRPHISMIHKHVYDTVKGLKSFPFKQIP